MCVKTLMNLLGMGAKPAAAPAASGENQNVSHTSNAQIKLNDGSTAYDELSTGVLATGRGKKKKDETVPGLGL